MDTKAQMRRNFLTMRRMQNIEQEDISLQKKIKEQYEKAQINHAALQYQKKLEKYRMHQLASQMKNLENNHADSKKRKQKKPQKMTSLMAIEAEQEQSRCDSQNADVETMVERDSKPTSSGKMGFLFQSNDIDDLVNSFCSKLKSKKKETVHYPKASYTRKKESLDEFISQQTAGDSGHTRRSSQTGIKENVKDTQHARRSSQVGVVISTDVEDQLQSGRVKSSQRINEASVKHRYSGHDIDKVESVQTETGAKPMNIATMSVQNSETVGKPRTPVRGKSPGLSENDMNTLKNGRSLGYEPENMNALQAQPMKNPLNVTSYLGKNSDRTRSDNSPELIDTSPATCGSDSGISSSSSSNINQSTRQRTHVPISDHSGLPQNKDPASGETTDNHMNSRGIPLKDIVAKKHRKKVPHGVNVKHCWAGDPEAINSIRRPIMSPHEKLLKQLVQRAMERKQEQVSKSSNQTPSGTSITTNTEAVKTQPKTKKTKKSKRSELNAYKDACSNPYPVYFADQTKANDVELNKQQISQTSRVYVEEKEAKHNSLRGDGSNQMIKPRPISAPVSKQPLQDHVSTNSTQSNVISLNDKFTVDISEALFRKEGSSRKSPTKPKHLTSNPTRPLQTFGLHPRK